MKYSYCFFLIFFFFTACETNDPVDVCSGFENKVYTFSLYSCTEADSLDCYQKRLTSVLLPEQYLKCSSTDSLARTCLMYPFLNLIWSGAYNTLQQGFNYIMYIFNGFDELFTRDDANIELIRIYREMDPEGVYDFTESGDRNAYMDQFNFIEITLAQFQLINKLTPQETELLIKICLDKYYDKSKITSYHWGRKITGLAIIARILYSQDYKPFMDEYLNISELANLIRKINIMLGNSEEEEITQFIISNGENYIEELKK